MYVAGPRLPAAEEEIETLRTRHPEATTLTREHATIANVARAIDGADQAHVAAHGRFRDDNPLFTSLELADGNVDGLRPGAPAQRPAPDRPREL